MKKVIFILSFLFCFGAMMGQSAFRTINAGGVKAKTENVAASSDVNASAISFNNAWFGSAFSYQISGEENFDESFLFNANLLYNIDFENSSWNFPIAGDFELPVSGGDFEQMEVGVYPWRLISSPESSTIWVLHGGFSYLLDPEDETEISPQTFRIAAGAEVSLPLANNNLPVTLSVSPLYEVRNLGVSNNFGVESVLVFPISANLGVLAEWYRPIDADVPSTLNVGVIVNGAIGN